MQVQFQRFGGVLGGLLLSALLINFFWCPSLLWIWLVVFCFMEGSTRTDAQVNSLRIAPPYSQHHFLFLVLFFVVLNNACPFCGCIDCKYLPNNLFL